jgi:hypothetical protein
MCLGQMLCVPAFCVLLAPCSRFPLARVTILQEHSTRCHQLAGWFVVGTVGMSQLVCSCVRHHRLMQRLGESSIDQLCEERHPGG